MCVPPRGRLPFPANLSSLAGGPQGWSLARLEVGCPRKDQGCHAHAMPCHVRPSPTPPRRDAAGCRASEPTGAWTGGGQRSNSAIIHLMLSHSQSRRPDGTHSFIPAHSSSNIRDIHEPVSQSASHPRSIPFPILPTFWPRRASVSQTVWPVRISVSTHPPPTTPYPAKKAHTQQSSGALPPILPASNLPASLLPHPPAPGPFALDPRALSRPETRPRSSVFQ